MLTLRPTPVLGALSALSALLALSLTSGCSETGTSDSGADEGGGGESADSENQGGNQKGSGGGTGSQSGGPTGSASNSGPGVTKPPVIMPQPSSGCDKTAPMVGARSLQVGDLTRSYVLSLPADYDSSTAYPLIFAFHGQGSSGAGVSGQYYFGIEQKGGKPSIFVYPDGLESGNGTGWPNDSGRDVAFFDALLESLNSELCIDESRVFSTGHSYGGIMSFTLACDRGDKLRAVAPVAGSRWTTNTCTGPVAIWGAHGNPDPTVAYDGGFKAFTRIQTANGCDVDSTTSVAPTEFCASFACDDGYPTVWCEHQSGHDWPDFAAASIKTFFDSF